MFFTSIIYPSWIQQKFQPAWPHPIWYIWVGRLYFRSSLPLFSLHKTTSANDHLKVQNQEKNCYNQCLLYKNIHLGKIMNYEKNWLRVHKCQQHVNVHVIRWHQLWEEVKTSSFLFPHNHWCVKLTGHCIKIKGALHQRSFAETTSLMPISRGFKMPSVCSQLKPTSDIHFLPVFDVGVSKVFKSLWVGSKPSPSNSDEQRPRLMPNLKGDVRRAL